MWSAGYGRKPLEEVGRSDGTQSGAPENIREREEGTERMEGGKGKYAN